MEEDLRARLTDAERRLAVYERFSQERLAVLARALAAAEDIRAKAEKDATELVDRSRLDAAVLDAAIASLRDVQPDLALALLALREGTSRPEATPEPGSEEELRAQLEAARKRLSVYEGFEETIESVLTSALRTASDIRTRAEEQASQATEHARAEARAAQEELHRLRAERDAIGSSLEELQRARTESARLVTENDRARAERETLERELEGLRSQREDLAQAVARAAPSPEEEALYRSIRALTETRERIERERAATDLDAVQQRLATYRSFEERVRQVLDEASLSATRAQEEMRQLREALEEMGARKDVLTREVAGLDAAREETERLREERERLSRDVASLRERAEHIASAQRAQRAALDELSRDVARLRSEREELTLAVSELRRATDTAERARSESERFVARLDRDVGELTEKRDRLEIYVSRLRQERGRLAREVFEGAKGSEEEIDELETLAELRAEVANEVRSLRSELARIRAARAALERVIEGSGERDPETLREAITELEEVRTQLERERARALEDLERAREQHPTE